MGYLSSYQEAKPHTHSHPNRDCLIRSALQGGVCSAAELSPGGKLMERILQCAPQAYGRHQTNISAKEASEQMREHLSCISG